MIVAMQEIASDEQIQRVRECLVGMGWDVHRSASASRTLLGAVGAGLKTDTINIETLPGVKEVLPITSQYKLVSRMFRPDGTVITFKNGASIGGEEALIMAGPCSVESKEQIYEVAQAVAGSGAKCLRGGAFKPRTSP